MKVIGLLLSTALFYSCNGTSQQKGHEKKIDENLEIKNKTTLTNTYTKSGVLDTSYGTNSIYLKGKFVIATNFIITRNYDSKNNLLTEKRVDVSETNGLLETGITISITKMYYNEHNQETKRIEMHNTQADNPELDFKNQSNPQYDTIIKVNFYDSQSNLIKQITSNSNNEVQFSLLMFYSNDQKSFSCELDENSDTLTTFKYKKVGDLIEETVVPKSDPNSYVTTWYEGKKKIKSIFYDSNVNKKFIETFKYDEKGNEVENILYE
jgi:hypothetical protein